MCEECSDGCRRQTERELDLKPSTLCPCPGEMVARQGWCWPCRTASSPGPVLRRASLPAVGFPRAGWQQAACRPLGLSEAGGRRMLLFRRCRQRSRQRYSSRCLTEPKGTPRCLSCCTTPRGKEQLQYK